MGSLWNYIITGGHLYKKSFWKEEYERIARDFRVSPDHVYAISKGGPLMDDRDREIKNVLRRKNILTSIYE